MFARFCHDQSATAAAVIPASRFDRRFSWLMITLYVLNSIVFPLGPLSTNNTSGAIIPGQQCRCSMAKRVSGSCCCRRESQPQPSKSCCPVVRSAPKHSQPASACCSKKSATQSPTTTPRFVKLSIAPCDCGSESPVGVSLGQEPRLPAAPVATGLSNLAVVFIALPVDRVESALLQPPVPPPKVVL